MNPSNPQLAFFIEGHPAPGGSKTVFPVWRADGTLVTKIQNGRVWPIFRITDAGGKNNTTWKAVCAVAARRFMGQSPIFREPLVVDFVFFLRRPQSHYRSGKFAHLLRDDAPKHHVQAPDALKYARGTEDALSQVVWWDDSSNVKISSEKRWADASEKEGCAVTITLLRS